MNGLLLIDKPSGWTSFDVVNRVRRMIADQIGLKPKNVKVGHTGTLDPLATGLLVLVIGDYCKRASEFSKLDKTYDVVARLGLTSTTGDEEGEKTSVSDIVPMHEEVETALKSFVGDIMQVPPAFSAMKVNGQRAYKLARAGQEVVLEARPTTIHTIEFSDYTYPEVSFTALVSSGTYIRSLVEDVGETLLTGAYMSALRRTTVGPASIEQAIEVDHLSPEAIKSRLQLSL